MKEKRPKQGKTREVRREINGGCESPKGDRNYTKKEKEDRRKLQRGRKDSFRKPHLEKEGRPRKKRYFKQRTQQRKGMREK